MKTRLIYLHKDINAEKVKALEALHLEYVAHVRLYVNLMIERRTLSLALKDVMTFFPRSEILSSQIEKQAKSHAIDIVSTWAKGIYARKMKKVISSLKREGDLSDDEAKLLYSIGSRLVSKPAGNIDQAAIEAYHELLHQYGGNPPTVRNSIPMKLNEMTGVIRTSKKAHHASHWIKISSLTKNKRISIPLAYNPYVSDPSLLQKSSALRKDKKGRWRLEVYDKAEVIKPPLNENAKEIGIDVGLNVLATDSNGVLYGINIKPKFDKLYARIKTLRANRQRQDLKENSKRLNRLEMKLSGMVKSETGRVANKIAKRYEGHLIITEDLDLRGCKGQKRFAYRELQKKLESKMHVRKVNPAYTSQQCPSCGYAARNNRNGIKFVCKVCGRKAHADWVGAFNILGRSKDESIKCDDNPKGIKQTLREQYRLRRNSSSTFDNNAHEPSCQKLTSKALPKGKIGIALNGKDIK